MKYLKTYEGRNTKYWFCRIIKTDDIDELIENYYKLISNPNVDEIKMFDLVELKYSKNYNFCIYISKEEKDKNFKGWSQIDDDKLKKLRLLGDEYSNDEIDDWIDGYELRNSANKYNL